MKEYLSVKEAGATIASEVTQYGQSKDWVGSPDIGRELESHLAKFNIGYTEPSTGTWAHKHNGTRYFTTLRFMNSAKNKVGNLLANLRK